MMHRKSLNHRYYGITYMNSKAVPGIKHRSEIEGVPEKENTTQRIYLQRSD